MHEKQLQCLGKKLLPKKYFLGVFSLSSLPKRLNVHQMCIVHRNNGAVGHWFAIHKVSKNILEVFDSLVAPSKVVNKISTHFDAHVYSNNERCQMPGTVTCGLFSLYFLFHRFLNLGTLSD